MKISEKLVRKLFSLLAVLGLFAARTQAQYVYTTIDDPVAKAAGGTTYVMGISGNVVVGYYYGSVLHGFYHTLGTTNYTTIDDPAGYTNGSSGTMAYGISGNYIVGSYQDDVNYSGYYGFVFNMATSNYTTVEDPAGVRSGSSSTQAYGIDGGNLVGILQQYALPYDEYLEAFVATPGAGGYNFSTFYYPSPSEVRNEGSYNLTNYETFARGIDGPNICGYWLDENLSHHGFVYNTNNGAYTMVTDQNGGGVPLNGINSNNVVGYYADPNHSYNASGFVYNLVTSNYTTLRVPAAPQDTYAEGISGNTVVGYYVDSNGVIHGFAASIPVPALNVKEVGTNLVFTATNGLPGASCFILDTTNLLLSMNLWPELSSNVFNTNGVFMFTNKIAPGMPPTYYGLSEAP